MTRIVLSKDVNGAVAGMSPVDAHHFQRLTTALDELRVGETLVLTWNEARSPEFHRAHFALLNRIFSAQHRFEKLDALRAWVTIGAGHCDTVPGPDGVAVVVARSISFDSLPDEDAFREHHARVLAFLRLPTTYGYLFPAASADQAALEVETAIVGDENA
jgi:hypothetical protein